MKELHAKIYGAVQRVNFRAFIKTKAWGLGLTGFCRNEPDGTVFVLAQGEKEKLEKLLAIIKSGDHFAKVEKIEFEFSEPKEVYNSFERK